MDAPHNSCLFTLSFEARGFSLFFSISARATKPTSSSFSLTTGSFPFLLFFKMSFASSKLIPSWAQVNSGRGVMNSLTLTARLSIKAVSRPEMIPSNLPPMFPVSVTGNEENFNFVFSSKISSSVFSGLKQTGSRMKPFLNLFTRLTSAAWSSAFMFEWIIPIPPCSAIVIAIWCSVTVSIGDDTKGTCNRIFFVRSEEISTSPTPKPMCPGITIKSS
mmetsp:Transcript_26435/g.61927  ORF Transcript_26435/g.61927 Transcript_26435/m.61927 type:complete len:218 (-) Transcript_26435:212-865(-)